MKKIFKEQEEDEDDVIFIEESDSEPKESIEIIDLTDVSWKILTYSAFYFLC